MTVHLHFCTSPLVHRQVEVLHRAWGGYRDRSRYPRAQERAASVCEEGGACGEDREVLQMLKNVGHE